MKTLQKGFTLIELMIVVAIVGILAAIALPAYQDYQVRARMTEPMAKLDEMKLSVAEYWSANGGLPTTNASAGFASAVTAYGSYVTDYGVSSIGQVGVLLNGVANANLNNTWLSMSPQTPQSSNINNAIVWTCGNSQLATSGVWKYLPSNCRNVPLVAFQKAGT